MSAIFDPSRNAGVNAQRGRHGYVASLVELPVATAKVYGYVVFCGEDKRFYECQHIVTDTEDYYRWVAVTSGGQRIFFIPVEKLTEQETYSVHRTEKRTNCFDAIASAIDEIALGLFRYNIRVDNLCYKPCSDTKYVEGRKYYIWHESYDRAECVRTTDTVSLAGKVYYFVNTNGDFEHYAPPEGTDLTDRTYFESTRPLFIADPDYVPGAAIDHRVFVSNGTSFEALTMVHLANKINELIDVINVTNAQITKIQNVDTAVLYDLCKTVNTIIDEVNPFANAWDNLLNRVKTLEKEVTRGTLAYPFDLPQYVKKDGVTYKCDIMIEGTEIKPVITPVV